MSSHLSDTDTSSLLRDAQRIADEILFPLALEADSGPGVPVAQLQKLADAGMYGASTQGDPSIIPELIEIIASGCLTTAFVWTQHLGAAAAVQRATGPVRAEWLEPLSSGRARAGVAFAHMLRPGEPLAKVTPHGDGWTMTGEAPWVTGWGHIDVVHAAARHDDDIVWALVDAHESSTLRSVHLDLAVVNASQTVVLEFDGHEIPADRVTSVENYEEWRARYQLGLRANGSLPLGVATRCCRLLDDADFARELVSVRDELNGASVETMPAARAQAALFAVRAATALVASTGGRAVTLHEHGQRLMREAMFLMVQGQTPAIKAVMLDRLRR